MSLPPPSDVDHMLKPTGEFSVEADETAEKTETADTLEICVPPMSLSFDFDDDEDETDEDDLPPGDGDAEGECEAVTPLPLSMRLGHTLANEIQQITQAADPLKALCAFGQLRGLPARGLWHLAHYLNVAAPYLVYHRRMPESIRQVAARKIAKALKDTADAGCFLAADADAQDFATFNSSGRDPDGRVPEYSKWPKAPDYCDYDHILDQHLYSRGVTMELGDLLCPDTDKVLTLTEALEIAGVISVSWPLMWGNAPELRNNLARLLVGINRRLERRTGWEGGVLGLQGRLAIHFGLETEDFAGRMRNRKTSIRMNQTSPVDEIENCVWFDMELACDPATTEQMANTIFHEWFHALDRWLALECRRPRQYHFSEMLPLNKEAVFSRHQDHHRAIRTTMFPAGAAPTAAEACRDLLATLEAERAKSSFGFGPSVDRQRFLLDQVDRPLSTQERWRALQGMLAGKHDALDFHQMMTWALIRTCEIGAALKQRGRPTRHHPSTILARLVKNSPFAKDCWRYGYQTSTEIMARSFEDFMMAAHTPDEAPLAETFWPLMCPSFPGADREKTNAHWRIFLDGLRSWWDTQHWQIE